MKATRHLISTIALVAALGGGLTACGPEDDSAAGSGGSSSGASAKPSAKPADGGSADKSGGEGSFGDCGQPPKLPAGHKMIEIAVPPSKGSMSAKDAKPTCTPNDWIYHGEGAAKYYLFTAGEVKAELSTGSGSYKTVPVGELWSHAGDCMTNQSAVKQPYTCSGNIYDITLDSEGKVKTIKEVWHP
ncbi:hypothetical protein [Streptomyces cinnamoneus]|uniref:Lipoprotein n=1 Tax=Streptomyces cinnamoneus TaxID=53446 RepID=A0A918WJ84_STRCJ|nr:hypothetical protein [Streptomyces cinnamoneus]GHC51488.1 hypothetical protein GCM10010507_29280 [Streptomyces cinnamoneus]